MNIYQLEITAMCPNGSLRDRYDLTIGSERVIQVEMIHAVVKKLEPVKMFQEDIADTIRNELQAAVVLIGWHFGVKVTCMRIQAILSP